jgi:probable rRNA maturation factor
MIRVNIFKEKIVFPEKISGIFIKNIVKTASMECGIENISINIIFCNNEFIKDINREFRKKDYPTDVLSFPDSGESFPFEKKADDFSGEIYISSEKTIQQAEDFGVKFRDELKRLIIHGFLHLIGYDHEISEAEEKKMFKKEEKIFKILNG